MPAFDLNNRMLWAIVVGWIISVILHEFAHGVVAYWGGDYTIRERGGLSLNPLQYVDPLFSIILPIIFLLMGGLPLPGGSTYIRRDLLRSRLWDSAVSLAGPAMNLILFFLCALPLHPAFGWINTYKPNEWSAPQVFLGAMAILQFIGLILNLVPIPPLDGYQAIAEYLPARWREKLSEPAIANTLFFIYFIALWRGNVLTYVFKAVFEVLTSLGFNPYVFFFAYREAFGF